MPNIVSFGSSPVDFTFWFTVLIRVYTGFTRIKIGTRLKLRGPLLSVPKRSILSRGTVVLCVWRKLAPHSKMIDGSCDDHVRKTCGGVDGVVTPLSCIDSADHSATRKRWEQNQIVAFLIFTLITIIINKRFRYPLTTAFVFNRNP